MNTLYADIFSVILEFEPTVDALLYFRSIDGRTPFPRKTRAMMDVEMLILQMEKKERRIDKLDNSMEFNSDSESDD